MKNYRLFLAYYTLISTIGLFVWSIFFMQKPQGFFLTLLIVPTSIYFWLLIAGTSKSQSPIPSDSQNKGLRFPIVILLTLFISSFSILLYSIMENRSTTSQNLTASQIDSLELAFKNQDKVYSEKIIQEIAKLKNQLANVKAAREVTEDTQTSADISLTVGTLTITDKKYATVEVYTEKSTSSAIIGKAEFGKTYTFLEKLPNWYLILIGTKEGFINSQFVKEVQY